MTTPIKLSLSDEVLALLDERRGLMSRQEFINAAVIRELEGRDTLEGLLRRVLDTRCVSSQPTPKDDMLSFE